MGMTDLITGGLGNQMAAGLSKKLGIDSTKATWILAIAVPLIAGAIKYNQSKGDASQVKGFADALDTKHDGAVLDHLNEVNLIFETLNALHKENRIVGIISHVDELQERIPASIKIVKDEEKGSLIIHDF